MKIQEILEFLDGMELAYTFQGDPLAQVERFSSLSHYCPGSFTWVKALKNVPEHFDLSALTLVFTGPDMELEGAANVIRTAESKRAFFSTIEHFYGEDETRPAVGQFTYIGPRVKLGRNVRIGHNCTLDGDITIGDDTVIWNSVVLLNRVTVGSRCDIHSGAVIGHDGYAYTEDAGHHKVMVKHFGGVSIGNDVLIGENVCISRGTIDDTVLEDGVKIDALGHIAHNCWFGRNAAMPVPCSVSGSVHVGENAYLAGDIIRNQCTIGENAFVGLGAVVVKDVAPGQTVVGNPAKPFIKKKA